jgi:tRNA threonylcarbamoyladenosine modification (KEOPS) complex Cgi121 subunit
MAGEMKIFVKAYLCGPEAKPNEIRQKLSAMNPRFMVQAARLTPGTNAFFLEMLAAQTLQAESSGSLLAKKPEIDFLLRLAGTTQIAVSIKDAGAREGEAFVVIVAGRSEVNVGTQPVGRELPRRKLSRAELDRIERGALLNARRP